MRVNGRAHHAFLRTIERTQFNDQRGTYDDDTSTRPPGGKDGFYE